MTEPACAWVYAVTGPVGELNDMSGIGGRQVRAIAGGGLTAFVSDVVLDQFDEAALRVNLEDMAWLEATAKAHHQVIDELAQMTPVVPMRLATVFGDDANVQTMLARRGDELRDVLSRISGRREWGVKAFATERSETNNADRSDEGSTDSSASLQAASAGESGSDAQEGSGAAYLRRRRDQLAAGRRTQREAAVSAESVHAALTELTADACLHPPQVPQLAGTKAVMLLNAAYLVDESEEDQFSAAVQQLASQHPAIRLQLTGPWPPYSFAGLNQAADPAEQFG